jgi:predicted ATP-dependent serine protease
MKMKNGDWFYDDLSVDEFPWLTGVSGRMGIGKTQMLAEVCRENPAWRVLYITNRRLLANAAASALGLTYYTTLTSFRTRVTWMKIVDV